MRHLAVLFQEAEHRKDLPRTLLDLQPLSFVQDARDVLVETAARDVADAVNVALPDHLEDLLHVDLRRREQHFAQQFVRQLGIAAVQVEIVVVQNLAHEAEPVRVDAARRNAHQHIARADLRSVDQFRLLDHAHRESGDVVLPVGVHARHLGRLAAHQGAARLTAPLGDARHDGLDLLRFVVSHGHVVEEQQRLGTLCQHVVDAHRHSVDADRIVFVHLEGQLEFRTHAVRTAHQHRFLHLQGRKVKHPAERPDVAHHARAGRRGDVFLDAPHHFVTGFEVHTGLFITLSHSYSWF